MTPSKTAIFPDTAIRQAAPLILKIIPVLLLLGGLGDMKVSATLIPAANGTVGAIQTAVNSAKDGDEVSVPGGTVYWNTNLVINNNISLVGAGIGQTIIVDEIPRTYFHGLILWNTISNYTQCELSGIQFQGGVTNTGAEISCALTFSGYCPVCHVTGCLFQDLHCGSIWFEDGAYGCIDHSQFYETNWEDQIYCENGSLGGNGLDAYGYGDVMWAAPAQYGSTTNWIYIETNQFWYPGYPTGFVNDGAQGTKVVFRYNTVTNMVFQNHGTESSQRNRGMRAFEVYGNYFINTSTLYQNSGMAVYLRSGTGIVFSNTLVNLGNLVTMENFRGSQNFFPWGGANGQNPWDTNNSVLIASGIHTGTNGSYFLEDSSANWTVGQWVGGMNGNSNWCYVVQDVTQGGGATQPSFSSTQSFGMIASNGVHDIYPIYGPNYGNISWKTGDAYKIYQSYAQLDQIGRGSGDLLQDNSWGSGMPIDSVTGKTNWPNEASEPLYQWGNTLDGKPNAQIGANIYYVNNGSGLGGYNVIIDGRDFYENTVKPNYTPLPFPHPLDNTNGFSTPLNFTLTVIDGAGGGSYASNAVVNISGNQTTNQVFAYWSGSDISNTNQANTTIIMPGANLTVTAVYYPDSGGAVQIHPMP